MLETRCFPPTIGGCKFLVWTKIGEFCLSLTPPVDQNLHSTLANAFLHLFLHTLKLPLKVVCLCQAKYCSTLVAFASIIFLNAKNFKKILFFIKKTFL
jgi:hypothetical protein